MRWPWHKKTPAEQILLAHGKAPGKEHSKAAEEHAALPRGEAGASKRGQRLPEARWAAPEELARNPYFGFSPQGPFLGVIGAGIAQTQTAPGDPYHTVGGTAIGVRDDRHMVLCAGSRAGKGRSVLIPTLLTYRGSVMTLDPKGELANITAQRRAAMGQEVHVLDPFGITAERLAPYRTGFNPMAGLSNNRQSLIVEAGLIADALVIASQSKDPHWDDSARNLIEGLIVHVASAPAYEGARNLVSVRTLLDHALDTAEEASESEEEFESFTVESELRANAQRLYQIGDDLSAELGAAVEGAAAEFYDKPPNERGGVLSTARRQTKVLTYPELRASLSANGPDLARLKTARAGMSIYLCLPAARMATCNKWYRLFINMMLEAMEREQTRPAIPVLAVLEEFHVLGHMQQIEVASGLIAGFGVKLLIVLQDLTQLKRHYKESWETFLGNAGVQMFFGNTDLTTLGYIRQRCGQTSLIVERGSEVSFTQRVQGGANGTSWSVEVRDLITSDEAAQIFAREDRQQRALLLCAGRPPAVIQRVKYDRHALLAGLYGEQD